MSSTLDPLESRVQTGLCGRSCYGLRIQQQSFVDITEFTLLSVLTRDRMMRSFSEFSGQFCCLSVTSHRHFTLCTVCLRARERFASRIPHDVVLTLGRLSGIVLWFVKKSAGIGWAQIPSGSEAVGCRLRHEIRVRLSPVIGSGLGSDPEVQGGWKEAARMVQLEREKNQLEDDLLKFLGKNDRMQKKIDEMTLNENHDAQLIAKVMKERDRLLAEKEQRSEENRNLKQQVGELKRVAQ